MVFSSKVILAVGAHPDDIELGCGGTLAAASANGAKTIAVYMTRGERTANPDERIRESKTALEILGVKDVLFGTFPDAEIPCSLKCIEFLEDIFEKERPDIVLTHTTNDTHQDHRQVAMLSLSAFRNVPQMLAYESPRVTGSFTPTYFVDISNHLECKWNALKCHLSQKAKRYITYESMINLASFRGSQVNLTSAEAFEVIRYVEKAPFRDIEW